MKPETALARDRRPTRRQVVIWIVLLGVMSFLSLRDFDSTQVGVYQDDATYVLLTRSLVESDRYGLINAPDGPEPTRYPFGYPLVLSPIARVTPELIALKAVSFVAIELNMALLFWGWTRLFRNESYWSALFVCALYGFSPLTIGFSRMVMSESIFLCFCLVTVILVESSGGGRPTARWCVAVGAALTLVVFTRTIGLTMFLAVVGHLSLKNGRIAWRPVTGIVATMIVCVLAVVILTPVDLGAIVPAEYWTQMAEPERWGVPAEKTAIGQRLAGSFVDYAGTHTRSLVLSVGDAGRSRELATAIGLGFLPEAVGWAIFAVLLAGLARWYRRAGPSTGLIFAITYAGALLLWPWNEVRFLYPLQPWIYLCLAMGLDLVFSRVVTIAGARQELSRHLVGLGLFISLIVLLLVSGRRSLAIDDSTRHVGDLGLRTAWLRERAGPHDVVLSEYPSTDSLYASLPTVPYPMTDSAEELASYLETRSVRWVLVAPELRWQARYDPVQSKRAQRVGRQMSGLVRRGAASLAFEGPARSVRVFRFAPPAHREQER